MILEELVAKGAEDLGIMLPEDAASRFRGYYEYITEKNAVMNLTAISGEEDTARLHFLDCIALLGLDIPQGASVIDIGSGAGFPGVPMTIARPDIKLTLLDAQQKRVGFLAELTAKIGLDSVRCMHARAEEAALQPDMRDSFDLAVSRAVARLPMLCELCMPFVHQGGVFIAMKSVDIGEELDEAKNAISKLGGKVEKVWDYTIPGTDVMHRAVVIRKTAATPKGYPRRFAKIQKQPL